MFDGEDKILFNGIKTNVVGTFGFSQETLPKHKSIFITQDKILYVVGRVLVIYDVKIGK